MKVSYYSLGCKVNEYESIAIINDFLDNGFELSSFHSNNDVYIINTCTVTNTADSKSRKIIRQAIKNNPDAVIAIMGCYAQLNPLAVEEIEGVDVVLGTNNRSMLYSLVIEALESKKQKTIIDEIKYIKDYEEIKINRYNNHTRGFIKIQDGCNNFCSFCAIPYARGRIRSRLKDDVISEINHLTNSGMKEIILSGINTGAYGEDFKNYSLVELLKDIKKEVKLLPRIRISSVEITELTDEFLEMYKNNLDMFCDHLHIPLQGGVDSVLKSMNRKYTTAEYKARIEAIKGINPNINITADVMVGFPGETNEDFEMVKEFIDSLNLGEIHVFPYSRRPGTKAYDFKDQVDNITKKYRVNELITLNKLKAIEYRSKFIGKELEVLVEKVENGIAYGHSSNYINIGFVSSNAKNNDLIKVKLTEVDYPLSIAKEIKNV